MLFRRTIQDMIDEQDEYSDGASPNTTHTATGVNGTDTNANTSFQDETKSVDNVRPVRKQSSVGQAVETLAGYVTGGMSTMVGLISGTAQTGSVNTTTRPTSTQQPHENA